MPGVGEMSDFWLFVLFFGNKKCVRCLYAFIFLVCFFNDKGDFEIRIGN